MDIFPAVLIGGPPHSGKSVLAYSLSQALRRRGIQHYVIRAYPDGEGDWANEADQDLVRLIRRKGQGTAQWVDRICRDIAQRRLPLIVDIGGKPTPDQERLFDNCTQAIILSRDEVTRAEWLERCTRHAVPLLADLASDPHGADRLTEPAPIMRGSIAGLERNQVAQGPVFEALTDRLADLFNRDQTELRRYHISLAPVELVIDLDRLATTLGITHTAGQTNWQPIDLPHVLEYLPSAAPLALYGRGPNWLYAALARAAFPADFYQFDPRLGWVQAQRLALGVAAANSPAQFHLTEQADSCVLDVALPQAYIDYVDLADLCTPPLPPNQGLIIDGKLPHWLWTSLTFTYAQAPWLAITQPQLPRPVRVHPIGPLNQTGS